MFTYENYSKMYCASTKHYVKYCSEETVLLHLNLIVLIRGSEPTASGSGSETLVLMRLFFFLKDASIDLVYYQYTTVFLLKLNWSNFRPVLYSKKTNLRKRLGYKVLEFIEFACTPHFNTIWDKKKLYKLCLAPHLDFISSKVLLLFMSEYYLLIWFLNWLFCLGLGIQ